MRLLRIPVVVLPVLGLVSGAALLSGQHAAAEPAHVAYQDPGGSVHAGGPIAHSVWDGKDLTNENYSIAWNLCPNHKPIVNVSASSTGYVVTVRCAR